MRKLLLLLPALVIYGHLTAQGQRRQQNNSRQLYLTQLKAAEAFYRLNEIPEAKKLLAQTPADQRGWEYDVLQSRSDRSIQTLQGHNKSVVGIAISSNGKILATGSVDSSILLWDAATGRLQGRITGHAGQVTTLDFSPDGRWLVSGSVDHSLRLWDVTTQKEISHFNNEFSRGIYQATFSPDGQKLGVVSWELSAGNKLPVIGFAKVLDIATGKVLHRFNLDSHPVSAIDFSSDSKKLLTASWGMFVDYHHLETEKKEWNYDLNNLGYYAAIQSAAISPDDQYILTGGKDSRIRLLEAATGKKLLQIDPHQGHNSIINSVRFSPDGSLFASAGDDGLIMVWETATGRRLLTFRGHEGSIHGLAWHPGGKRLYSSSADRTVKVWDLTRPGEKIIDICRNGPWYAPVTADGNYIAGACSDKRLAVWDLNTGYTVSVFDSIAANCAAFSNDGKYLYSGGHDRLLRGFDMKAKKEMFAAEGHTGSIYGVAASAGLGLAASAGDKTIRLWNMQTGDSVNALRSGNGNAYTVQFTPDNRYLVAGYTTGRVNIYNTSGWKLTDTLQSGTSLHYLAIHPSGKYMATGGSDGRVFVWDLAAGKLLYELNGHKRAVYGISFHPAKPYMITVSYDREAKFWDLSNGECTLTLNGFDQELYTTSITSNGNRIILTETEGLVHVIDLGNE